MCVCVPSGAHLVSQRLILWRYQETRVSALKQHTVQHHKHKTQCPVASCSLTRCLAEYKSVIIQREWTSDNTRADFLKEEPYWWRSDHLRDRPTDRQAVSPGLPAASMAAPIEGSKTSKAGTFRALGRDSYILKLYSSSCSVKP